jgi:hypothetical protein
MAKDIWQEMKARWPSAIVSRQEAGSFSGGAISPKFLANCDSQGIGVQGAFNIGRKVCYPVDSLIDWLRARASK